MSTSGGIPASTPATLNPPGAIIMYGAVTAPAGWLVCDGAAVSRVTYAALFAVIGTAFGAGDGTTTFNVPDMRNNFPMGTNVTLQLGLTGGNAIHSHGAGSYAAAGHTHGTSTITVNSHTHALSGGSSTGGVSAHNHNLSGGSSTGAVSAHHHGLGSHQHTLAGGFAEVVQSGGTIYQNRITTGSWNSTQASTATSPATDTTAHTVGAQLGGATDGPSPTISDDATPTLSGHTDNATPTLSGHTDVASANGLTGSTDSASPAVTGTSDVASSLPPYLQVGFIIKT